jgi:hypothetical protein
MDKTHTKGMRFSDQQVELIRNTFQDEALIKVIRKAFYGVDLLDADVAKLNLSKEVLDVIKMQFQPAVSLDSPIGQNVDYYMALDLKDKSVDEIILAIETRKLFMKYIDIGLSRIANKTQVGLNHIITFSPSVELSAKTAHQFLVELFARNMLVQTSDSLLKQLQLLATAPDESEEEQKKKAKLNSAK